MYIVTGGGYGGSMETDGISNGCSTIGISKTPPIEILEQRFPVLFEEFAIAEGSAGLGAHRGGFGVSYTVRLRRGEARASFVMDHGRVGPPGILGGADGAPNRIAITQGEKTFSPLHLSKDQDIELQPGDLIRIWTPGGGGYGKIADRDFALVERDRIRGYFGLPQTESLSPLIASRVWPGRVKA
jgi:N-methylhydantoinase B